MKKKLKFFSFFFIFLFILFTLGVKNLENKNSGAFIQAIKSALPLNIKEFLKRTVFSIPTLNRKTDRHAKIIDELNDKIEKLNIKLELIDGPDLLASETIKIKSKENVYNLRTFNVPFIAKYTHHRRMKAAAYLEQNKSQIFLASGYGEFFSIEKTNMNLKSLNLQRIKSNIKNVIRNEKFYAPGFMGIRDLLLLDNKIFFSYVKEQTDGCYNTSIMAAELNLSYLNFSEFFSDKECLPNESVKDYPQELGRISLAHSGGRMVSFKNEKILLTTGDLGYKTLAQDKNSIFGKIISIDLKSKKYKIIAMGSRNAQGLYYNDSKDIIIHTEHGPTGGDEININFNPDNKVIENYGWPISSYGVETGVSLEEAPFHKSHEDYGFIEPAKYYTPSIAISEIIKIPNTFNEKFSNDFFVGALGYKKQIDEGDRSIHHIRFNNDFNQIIFNDIIPIGERIRDMIYIKEKNIVFMLLESIPAIGILELAN